MSQTKAQLIDPVDGSIVNADINASAAIAGSKISPSFTSSLSVNTGTTNTCATFTSTDSGAVINVTDNSARSSIEQNGTDLKIISDTDAGDADSTIKFLVDNSTKMTLNSSGNLGIGTASPDDLLEVSSTTADKRLLLTKANSGTANQAGMTMHFQNFGPAATGRNDGTLIGRVRFSASQPTSGGLQDAGAIECRADGTQTGNNTRSRLSFLTVDSQTATERMRIDKDGKVLIGVTSSSYKFHVDASNLAAEISVDNDSSNYKVALNSTNSVNADFNVQHRTNLTSIGTGVNIPLIFHINGGTNANSAEKMRLDTSGNLGINTASPVEKLGVSGNIRFVNPTGTTSRINALASGSYNVGNSGGSAVCFQRFSDSGGGSDEIFFETHHQGSFHGESLRIEKTGDIKVKRGDLYFETAGKGIVLGATSNTDANTLEDYEEGTFNGTATAAGYTGGIALTSENYTKIGRTVHFNCVLTVASSLSDGDLTLSGLPFSTAQDSVVDFSWQDSASFAGGQGKISGTQCVRFGGTFPSHHTGNANIIFSGTYRTAA